MGNNTIKWASSITALGFDLFSVTFSNDILCHSYICQPLRYRMLVGLWWTDICLIYLIKTREILHNTTTVFQRYYTTRAHYTQIFPCTTSNIKQFEFKLIKVYILTAVCFQILSILSFAFSPRLYPGWERPKYSVSLQVIQQLSDVFRHQIPIPAPCTNLGITVKVSMSEKLVSPLQLSQNQEGWNSLDFIWVMLSAVDQQKKGFYWLLSKAVNAVKH